MAEATVDVSVVFPCLNEEATLESCLRAARATLSTSGRSFELIVADNGSTDRSLAIAAEEGARVVPVPVLGYGNALREGMRHAAGRHFVFLDADMSYDCGDMPEIVKKLEEGADLVIGSRFRGQIDPGSMPALHRMLGTPMMTKLANVLFGCGITDINCGLRGLTRDAFARLDLRSEGMEFASEMVIKAAQRGLRIEEVPIHFHADQRNRAPHLRSFHDGWRHLQLMMHFCPLWVFVGPGLFLAALGMGAIVFLPASVSGLITYLLTLVSVIAGVLILLLGLTAQGRVRGSKYLFDQYPAQRFLRKWVKVENGLLLGLAAIAFGATLLAAGAFLGFESSTPDGAVVIQVATLAARMALLGSAVLICGLLVFFTCVYIGLFGIRVEEDTHAGS